MGSNDIWPHKVKYKLGKDNDDINYEDQSEYLSDQGECQSLLTKLGN